MRMDRGKVTLPGMRGSEAYDVNRASRLWSLIVAAQKFVPLVPGWSITDQIRDAGTQSLWFEEGLW
jgi:hypothetical protein